MSRSGSAGASGDAPRAWDTALVRGWLDSRIAAARLDQAAAERRGYSAADEYDEAAAAEWVCGRLRDDTSLASQAAFAGRVKALLDQDDYPAAGIHDDRRFERHVRATLRNLARMAKANEGFANTARFQ